MNTQQAINEIKKSQGATLPIIIADLIKSNLVDEQRMKLLWSEYLGNVPIKDGTNSDNPARPENRIANDFRGLIVQQTVGYLFGSPVKVTVNGEAEKYKSLIDKFLKRNFYDKLDAELGTYLAVTGKGYRLLYYDDNLDIIMKNIKPWEAIVISDSTIDEPQYGLIYYPVEIVNGNSKKSKIKVEFYDNKNVYYFIQDSNDRYVPDDTYGESVQAHGFDLMPLVKFTNNTLETGDFEKVRTLIDAYDSIVSGATSDFRAYAMAYLVYYGIKPTMEQIQLARKTGAFFVPTAEEGSAQRNDIKFLTKDPNTQNFKELADRLNNDIFRFSATVDFNDEKFASAQSGEARKYKLISLEQKSVDKERYFKYGLTYMYKVITSFWKKLKGVNIDFTEIEFEFSRNLPLELTTQDLIALNQAGIISTETTIENLTFIENPMDEYERVVAENESKSSMFNLDSFVTGSAA